MSAEVRWRLMACPDRPAVSAASRAVPRRTARKSGLRGGGGPAVCGWPCPRILFGYAWLAASTRPFTFMSLLVVLLPGAVVAGVAIWGPPDRIEAPDRLDITGFSWWLVVVAVLFEWEAAGFRDNSPWWHPSLTELVNPIIAPYPLRAIAFFLWLITGWALVRR